MSWKRLSAAVGLEPETMMLWERGVTRDPPIGKVLLFAREVGLTLEEVAAVALPANGAQEAARDAGSVEAVGDAIRARPVGKAAREPQKRHRRS